MRKRKMRAKSNALRQEPIRKGRVGRMETKILRKHNKDCRAAKNHKTGFWSSPWAYLDRIVYRDSMGRKHPHGSSRWWIIRCNDPDCYAQIMVKEKSILEALPKEQP
jgi:hypothetical protein